jgi:hypothetical protein
MAESAASRLLPVVSCQNDEAGLDGRARQINARLAAAVPQLLKFKFERDSHIGTAGGPSGQHLRAALIQNPSRFFAISGLKWAMSWASPTGLLEMYQSGDPYWSFAKRVGAIPSQATKDDPEFRPVRDKYKNMLLAVQYGMSVPTLAARLNVSTFEAHEMLSQHKALFAQYWHWSDDWVATALQTGVMRTAFGWSCRTGITELNERSIRNWLIQATGADILRIACILGRRYVWVR